VSQHEVDRWLAAIDGAVADGSFFGACNYVTYCAVKPG